MAPDNSKYYPCFFLVCFFLVAGLASSSPFISDDVFQAHGSSGRALLQAKKTCNASFQDMDYSILTSKCKGPAYPAKQCCDAFKEFACPYAESLNDLETDCATTMFSYINLYGKYPPGLFANECREGKEGLDCQQVNAKSKPNGGRITAAAQSSLVMMAVAGALVLLFQLI